MCGRTACFLAPDNLTCSCKYKDALGNERNVEWVQEKFQTVRFVPSYNAGPRDILPCIVAGSHFDHDSERVLCPMMWGMIPPWHQGEYKKHNATTHNGRLEGLSNSKLYGRPLKDGRRCVVVINGFYEWQMDKKSGTKQPFYMHKKTADDDVTEQQVLTLAGIFDKWKSAEGEVIYSFTIITTDANEVLSWLHHRAPVILQTEKDVEEWLDYKNIPWEKALDKIKNTKLSSETLQWHPVASTVNNVRYKDKSCINAVTIESAKKKPTGGLMSSWLKTGSMTTKRKLTDSETNQDGESNESTAKVRK